MTRNWRVDEEALIPNWKGFKLFLALLQPPSSLFLSLAFSLSLVLSFTRSRSSRTLEHRMLDQ